MQVERPWIDSLRELPEYTYGESGPSLLDVLLTWFNRFIYELLDGQADSVADFVGYVLIAVAIVAVVYLLTRSGRAPVQIDRRGHVREHADELAEAEDLDRLIGSAIHDGRYREAVRYLYLRALADLRDANLIEWRAEKTDSEYVREVRGRWEQAEAFARAVRHFQAAWYGEHPVDAAAFAVVREQFDALRRHR